MFSENLSNKSHFSRKAAKGAHFLEPSVTNVIKPIFQTVLVFLKTV